MIGAVEWIGSAGISLLLAVFVAVFVLSSFYVARSSRDKPAAADDRIERVEQAIGCLQGEIRQWRHIASQLATRQRQLEERQDSIDMRDGAEHTYRMAIKLARRGAEPAELADTCGLTRGEAELLSLLHQGRQTDARRSRKPPPAPPVRKIA